jgi:tetratricopeptide (TPR) repeat protein
MTERRGIMAKNGDVKEQRFKKFMEYFNIVWKVPPRIAASVGAVITGLLALWEGYGQWWFGFRPSAWVLIPIVVALNVVWLIAFCGYLSDRKKEEEIKLFSWNTLLMITLPVLVLGILLGYFTMRWRLAENKIVILVEPFVDVGQVQDGSASGKDPEGIAEIVKSHLEKAIPLKKRLKVRVVLGKRHDKGSGEEMPLEERALKYRADMVISGWYVKRGEKFIFCPKFQVFRTPKPLPAAFMQSGGTYPKTFVFSNKEVENFNVNFTLGKLLTYEATMVLGAGAYASNDWKTAQQFFRTALQEIEKLESPEKGSETKVEPPEREAETKVKKPDKEFETKKSGASSKELENLKGDKALLQLYMGHCLMNQSEFGSAIQRYDDAIEAGKKVLPSDMRYGEILANAYHARGVAYRQVNAFELAGQDFQTAGGHLPTSLGLRPLHAEEARFLRGDRERLVNAAEKHYSRGDKYLIQEEYKHAEAYLEMSVEFYRTLMKGMPTSVQEKHSLELARSLVRLGEVHHRQAGSENPEYAARAAEAIKKLKEANKILKDRGDDDSKRLRAECLRHLGIAHFAEQQRSQYDEAIKSHEEAKGLWEKVDDSNEVAGELVRIGDVHRRLATLGKTNLARFEEAIKNYEDAAKELGAKDYLDSPDSDPNAKGCELVKKAVAAKNAHHLANTLTHFAEAHIEKHREMDRDTQQKNWKADPNDLSKAIGFLDCAVKCYRRVLKEMDKEDEKVDEDKKNQVDKKKKEKEEKQKTWSELLAEERNPDLRDDLAWCLTIRGYGLLMQARHLREQGLSEEKEDALEEAEQVLQEAQDLHRELPGEDEDKDNLAWNLFALAAAQYELGEKDSEKLKAGERSLLKACKMLRKMTRKKKKIWFSDYLEDSLTVLAESKHVRGLMKEEAKKEEAKKEEAKKEEVKKEEREKRGDIDKLGDWWRSSVVREGKEALDNIITALEEKTARSQ